jgi:acetyltransferase-like isoleucine patch superfamily enzyme
VFIGSHVKLYSKRQIKIGSKTNIRDFFKIDALSSGGVDIGNHCALGEYCRIECTGSLEHIRKGV